MMADVLDEDMPELKKEDLKKKEEDLEGNDEEAELNFSAEPGTGASSLWEDEDMKQFYENLGKLLCSILNKVSESRIW